METEEKKCPRQGEAYARAVSEHVEDCNWARACELQYEYNLKNPEALWDPYWAFALILLLTSNKDGFSLKEKEDAEELS